MQKKKTDITIPHDWTAQAHQRALLYAMWSGYKRAACVWHRRAGKDSVSLNWTAQAMIQRVGVYWHMLPTATQARKVVWNGIDREGRRIIDQVFPPALRKNTYKNEMLIELRNGSMWQLVGSDNYDALVGANPCGVVMSEYSVADPRAWDYIRPILTENNGWGIFIYTPRGMNHGYEMYEMAQENEKWFSQLLTVHDTHILTEEDIAEERRAGMSEAMIQQEFYCSFEASLEGAYYGKLMDQARMENRITRVPYDPSVEVLTIWDLGMGDSTAIWFVQKCGQEWHCIDYYENSGEGIAHYARILKEKGYSYGAHYAPHDIRVRELGTGRSRLETAQQHGIRFEIAPHIAVDDGIEAARTIIPMTWFDKEKCKRGIEGLKSYRKNFNDKMQAYSNTPVHDWASHPADAFRYFALIASQAYHVDKPLKYPKIGIV